MDTALKNGATETFGMTKNVVTGVVELPMKIVGKGADITVGAVEGGKGMVEEVTNTTTDATGNVFDWLGSFCGLCS